MDLDGSHQIKLFEGNEPCCFGAAAWAGPIWAPDGTKIAFITANQNHLYAIGADGGNPVDLGVALGRAQPAWRPVP